MWFEKFITETKNNNRYFQLLYSCLLLNMFKVRLKSFENIENPYKIQKPDYNTSKQIAFSQWLH